MANYRQALDIYPIFSILGQVADAKQWEVYVIGGFVRDLILNRPSKDIDIVVVGSGIAFAEAVAQALPYDAKVNTFKSFGTAQIRYHDLDIEFVGARKESYRSDSRKPIVEDGTLEDDQLRRDFTINALGICLNQSKYGELIDPFQGLQDVENKVIRTPLNPDVTFSDDPLRMLRAVRFASQLSFDIDTETFLALGRMKDRMAILAQERVTDELNKIILSPKPSYGFKLLDQAGILQGLFPDLVKLKGVETQDGKSHKDNFYHTLQVLDNVALRSPSLWVRWAALLHDIAKPATKRFHPKVGWTFHGHEELGARWVKGIFRKFKLPLDHKMRSVENLVRLHLRPIALAKEGVTDSALRRLLVDAGADLEDLMILCRADITSKDPNRVRKYLKNFDRVEEMLIELEEKDKLRNFQPIITGEMIMAVFGLHPSREVGLIKTSLREAILDGIIPNTFPEAFEFLLIEGARHGFKPIQTAEDIAQLIPNATENINLHG